MANTTYGPKIQRDENGDLLTVAAGGTLDIEGTLKKGSETGSTGTAFVNYGVTRFGSTAPTKTFTMAAPAADVEKTLICTQASGTGECWVDLGAGVSASGGRYLEFNASNESVTMIGRSATVWDIVSNVGSVASATSTTG